MLITLLVVALLVSSCNFPGPPEGYDWCYTYDFRWWDPFNVSAGSHEMGLGYVSDINNNLNITHSHDVAVNFLTAVIDLRNGDFDNLPAVTLSAAGELFGVDILINETMPAGLNGVEYPIQAASPNIIGYDLNVSMSASSAFIIRGLTLYGRFENPFGISNCGDFIPTNTPAPLPTSTPFPTVATSTLTPTPEQTETASITPTPTITPTPSTWCTEWYFANGDGGWVPWHGSYSAGVGFVSALTLYPGAAYLTSAGIHNNLVSYYTVTSIDLGYELLSIGSYTPVVSGAQIWTDDATNLMASEAVASGPQILSWSGVKSMNNIHMRAISGYDSIYPIGDPGGNSVITYLKMQGSGSAGPWGASNCATPTPTPTQTYTPSSTPGPTNTRTPAPTWTTDPNITPTLTRTPSRTPIPVVSPQPPTLLSTATQTYLPGTSTPNFTGTWEAGTATATVLGTGTPLPGTAVWDGPGGDIGDIGGGVLAVGTNLFNTVMSWLGTAIGPVTNLVGDYWSTAAEAPPGYPRCKTDPQNYELCAIYYIIENTVLSGVLGSLIIPFATLLVDIWIILKFTRMVRAIIARATKVTDSS
ncbi:MAG: hypothetical protein L6Q98_24620 [Anaerolineae bacterium]|nr:hypothetical protein [Anaerolineae bacterium]NUQ07163.1 hypothetical protein [Anaerolineae bacterium]